MMKWYARYRSGFAVLAISALALMVQPLPSWAQDDEDDGPRQPPPTRSSDTLSERVFRVISDVQEMMNPEGDDEVDLEGAKEELDELNERYDSLNDFEKSTLLNFYTNYYLAVDDVQSALETFERILTIEELRVDARLRALMALGQIYAGEERYREAIDAFNQWRELSEEESATVFLLLANSHYNLENFDTAIPYLLDHMAMLEERDREVRRNIYSLLNVMYIETEQYELSRDTLETMIILFDEPADWRNLAAVYGFVDDDESRIRILELAYHQGYLESEGQFMNLAQSLAGMDAPIRGVRILEDGMAQGIVEEDGDNLRRLTQMYMMAAEFEQATDPALRYAEVSDEAEAYDYLGYINYMSGNYAEAADAIQQALDMGLDEDAEADAYLFLARSLVELERFDEAASAARTANELGNNSAESYITYIERTQQRFQTLEERREQAIDFYQCPELQGFTCRA
ncbi:MAG: tetratricopeptide repeat protein [Pseudohongiellaceae bacterium]